MRDLRYLKMKELTKLRIIVAYCSISMKDCESVLLSGKQERRILLQERRRQPSK